jgi:hypothetical protein
MPIQRLMKIRSTDEVLVSLPVFLFPPDPVIGWLNSNCMVKLKDVKQISQGQAGF